MLSIRTRLGAFLASLAFAFPAASAIITINVSDNSDYPFGGASGPSNNNGIDSTGCTLRKAMQNVADGALTFDDCTAGSSNPADEHVITFSNNTNIQIGTVGVLPFVNKKLTINGPKTITGVNAGLGQSEIFHVANSGNLIITGFTLTGAGNSAVRVDNGGKFSATTVDFTNNKTDACCGGAVIVDNGTLNLTNVNFLNNTATASGGSGGAIHLTSTDVNTITNANFTSNSAADSGGAIYVSLNSSITPATLSITNSLFTLNKASGASNTMGGGAIWEKASGALSVVTIANGTFISNEADGSDGRGGAIFNDIGDGNNIVDHSHFFLNKVSGGANATGGAIYSSDNMIVRTTSFISNDAGSGKGGAFAANAPAPSGIESGNHIVNSTMQGNTAAAGGAVYSFGQFGTREIKLVHVTIDGNSGGGIFTENIGGGTAITRLANTIVSNNTGGNCTGNPVNNIAGNLQFPGSTCAADTAITTGDPKLDAPFINPPDVLTLTMALQAGSAASNGGSNAECTALSNFVLGTDQRLMPRPQGMPNCDIGAYESTRAPGYGSAPAPGANIFMLTFSGVPTTQNVVISETGDDNLTITGYGVTANPLINVSGTAAPFSINDGSGLTETLTLTCSNPAPAGAATTLSVSHNAPSGNPATYNVSCLVVDPIVITTASPLPGGFIGSAYVGVTFAATGGSGTYVDWSVTAGALPPGLTLVNATGVLSGTPTLPGVYNFTITVTDSLALTGVKAFQLTVVDAPSITTASPLPGGLTGTAYVGVTFAATGGSGTYTNWAVTLGALPPGLTLAAGTGQLTGTPTLAGIYNFTVEVTDSLAQTGNKAFQLTVVDPITITTATPLPQGTQNAVYPNLTFAATGGSGTYVNWIVTLGALPTGVTLNAGSGLLSGTPTVNGTFNFTVQVTDSNALTATKAFQLTINAPPTITTATPLPGGTQGTAYVGVTFAATGGTIPYVNWAVTVGSLPPGLTLAPGTGVLSGTPSTTVGSPFNFTIQVTDSVGATATKAFSLTVVAPLSITTATPLPSGVVSSAYVGVTFAATGGTPPYVNWAVTVGSLPPGLTLAAATGVLSGTPTTTVGSPFSFTIQVTDNVGGTATKAFTLDIFAGLSITTPTPLPAGTVSTVYSGVTFAAAGGTPPYVNWAVTVGSLPPGLTLAAATGVLSGTPTTAVGSPFSFTIQVTDNVGGTATKAFTLAVTPALSITTATPLTAGTVGTAYPGVTFAATGGTPPYVNWAVTVGSLPPGLTLAAGTGVLSGTPTSAVGSPFAFTIQVTDNVGGTATKAFTLAVTAPPLSITTATPLPSGQVSTVYSGVTFAATGGTPPYVNWAVTVGSLPPGLTLAAATGVLSGTPTTAVGSPFSFTIQVTDNVGGTATKAFTLAVTTSAPPTITTATPLPSGQVSTVYSGVTFAATGGTPPYVNWAVTVGSLPPGLTLAAATGVLSGTPTTAVGSPFSFTIQVTDNVGGTATKAFTLAVTTSAPPTITTASPLPQGNVGAVYSGVTFAATGGTPPYTTWAVTVGTLPPGLTLAAATGVLSGTPTTAGVYNFTIQVTDTASATATKAFALTVAVGGCFTGAATGGNGTACVTGGGPTCDFTAGTARFIPVTGDPASPPAGSAPTGVTFPQGLFTFSLSNCTPGSSITLTVTYPAPIPAGALYWKYGPRPGIPTPAWYVLPATIVGNSATFTIVDGQMGDDDLLANGTIVDQGGPGVPIGGSGAASEPTPTLSEWAMIVLAMLMLVVAGRRRRLPSR